MAPGNGWAMPQALVGAHDAYNGAQQVLGRAETVLDVANGEWEGRRNQMSLSSIHSTDKDLER
jgi:hypothetical protein